MRYLPIAALLLPTLAFAQGPSPRDPGPPQAAPSPLEQALMNKLSQEYNAGLQCNANNIAGQAEIQRLQVQIKGLKDKYEPVEPPKAPEKKDE